VRPYAYELELPDTMKIHPTFHVSLLQPSKHDPIGRQVPEPPPVYVENDEGPYFIDSIDDMRWNGMKRQFELLIKWEGYETRTWEPYDTIKTDAPEGVKEFHEDHPSRPAPAGWVKDGNKRLPPDTRTMKQTATTRTMKAAKNTMNKNTKSTESTQVDTKTNPRTRTTTLNMTTRSMRTRRS
jgi:hypothetical protein